LEGERLRVLRAANRGCKQHRQSGEECVGVFHFNSMFVSTPLVERVFFS
jgi:hypothetical protein